MLVINAGSGDKIYNAGTIELEGINGRAIQAISTNADTPTHVSTKASSVINVAGERANNGTRNYAVWVE